MGRIRIVSMAAVMALAGACSTSKPATPAAGPGATNAGGGAAAQGHGMILHPSWKDVALDPAVEKGLEWLVSAQGPDGGWGQDGGKDSVIRHDVALESQGNDIANTSLVCLTLMRAGSTPSYGKYQEALRKAVD